MPANKQTRGKKEQHSFLTPSQRSQKRKENNTGMKFFGVAK